MKIIFPLILLLTAILFNSCKDKNSKSSDNSNSTHSSNYESSKQNYHEDDRYKYENRAGNSGNYQYNYDVDGTGSDGNNVSGNVDIQGKYGSGMIEDENGNKIDVEVEWTGYGTMEGTDDDGNTYELNPE